MSLWCIFNGATNLEPCWGSLCTCSTCRGKATDSGELIVRSSLGALFTPLIFYHFEKKGFTYFNVSLFFQLIVYFYFGFVPELNTPIPHRPNPSPPRGATSCPAAQPRPCTRPSRSWCSAASRRRMSRPPSRGSRRPRRRAGAPCRGWWWGWDDGSLGFLDER